MTLLSQLKRTKNAILRRFRGNNGSKAAPVLEFTSRLAAC